MSSMLDLRINVLDGDPFNLSIASDATVGQLKTSIKEKSGIEEQFQVLLYLGHVMDQEKTLVDYNVHSGVCIQLVNHRVCAEQMSNCCSHYQNLHLL